MKEMRSNEEKYVPPAIEIIAVENEGMMAVSGGGTATLPELPKEPLFSSRSRSSNTIQSASPLQELEDMMNDLFTVKK